MIKINIHHDLLNVMRRYFLLIIRLVVRLTGIIGLSKNSIFFLKE